MVFFKIASGVVVGTAALAVVSDTFRYKLDRNVFRPVRNYKAQLDDHEKFQTQEEFYQFWKDLGCGVINMFKFEE